MANRTFNKDFLGLIKRRAEVILAVNVGAAGAVTLLKRQFSGGAVSFVAAPTTGPGYAVGNGEGVRSVERTGTGAWKITLSDAYLCTFGAQLITVGSGTGVPSIAGVGLVSTSSDITVSTGVGSGGVIAIKLVDFAGSAADPANGETVSLAIVIADASEP